MFYWVGVFILVCERDLGDFGDFGDYVYYIYD
jgi:hypothetical protein